MKTQDGFEICKVTSVRFVIVSPDDQEKKKKMTQITNFRKERGKILDIKGTKRNIVNRFTSINSTT